MLSSFFSGISGLMANSSALNVVGNNIANVNTVGFKSSRANFADALYQSINGTSGSSQVGRGTALSSVDTSFAAGSTETTTEATDLAIGGKGFFIVRSSENETNYFTRAGQFRFDKDGNLTNPGGDILQGRAIDRTTNAPGGVDTDIIVAQTPSEPRATALIGMVANLQSNAPWKGTMPTIPSGGEITNLAASDGKYPMAGDYTATTATRTADHTGGSAPTFPISGDLVINGTTVTLSGVANMAALRAAINVAGVNDLDSGGALQLQAAAAGTDIVVDDSGITAGSIGWSTTDKTSSDLYGATLGLSVIRTINGVAQPADTFSGNISASAGTATNVGGSGLDITHGAVTAGPQTFTIDGFNPTYTSALNNQSTTSNYASSVSVYDSLGQPHVVNVYFRKAYETTTPQESVWEWHACLSANDANPPVDTDVQSGYLRFSNSGTLSTGGEPHSISFDFSQGAQAGQVIDLVFGSGSGGGSTTQYPIASTTNFQTQDGYPPGVLQNVTVSAEGTISGHYSNGQILNLYQITLANFNNPNGLRKEGGTLYSETLASGVAYTSAPGEGGLGKLSPNSLEQSNVDLATEFVKMIIAQRGFSANSKVITTTDEVLQELMSLKR